MVEPHQFIRTDLFDEEAIKLWEASPPTISFFDVKYKRTTDFALNAQLDQSKAITSALVRHFTDPRI